MKRMMLIAFLGLMSAAPAFAQEAQPQKESHIDRLAGKLGLDAAGEAKLQQTFEKYRAQIAPLRQDARQTRQALRAELQNPTPNEGTISSLTSKLQGDRRQMMSVMQQRSTELKSVLTPSQYAKLMLRQGHFGRRFHKQGE